MTIPLIDQQWAALQRHEQPVRVSGPAPQADVVLVRAEVYERFKSLFEDDPITRAERLAQLQQFGRRAGWDDPATDVYDDLDPRRPLLKWPGRRRVDCGDEFALRS